MARKRKKQKEENLMNMTPMIDVTFLIIIFFLCLEFKTLEGKLNTNLPKDIGVNTSIAIPIEKLDVYITCPKGGWGKEVPDKIDPRRFEVIGHKVHWMVGPTRVDTPQELERLLRKEAERKVKDPKTLKLKTKPITINFGPGVAYQDVTTFVDIAMDAGFTEITFGGGGGTRKSRKGSSKG